MAVAWLRERMYQDSILHRLGMRCHSASESLQPMRHAIHTLSDIDLIRTRLCQLWRPRILLPVWYTITCRPAMAEVGLGLLVGLIYYFAPRDCNAACVHVRLE